MTDRLIYKVERDPDTLEYIITEINGENESVTKYKERYSPNRKQLREMLESAKGDDRSMARFAAVCSDKKYCPMNNKRITPPVLSRIMQENEIKRPLKPELIQALLNNASDRSKVTPDNLMRANGFENENTKNSYLYLSQPSLSRFDLIKKELAIKDLNKAIECKGFKVIRTYPDSSSDMFTAKEGRLIDNTVNKYDLKMDLDYVITAEDKKGKRFTWGFVIDRNDPEDIGNGKTILAEDYYDGTLNGNYDSYADGYTVKDDNRNLLLRSLIDPDSMKDIVISIVCQNRNWYNEAVEAFEDADLKIGNYVSVILIQWGEIVSEYTVNNTELEHPECLLGEFCERNEENYYRDGPEVEMPVGGKRFKKATMLPPKGYC